VIFGREPVAIAAFIAIAINLAITFGLQLSVEQVALVNTLVVAGLGLLVRQSVFTANTTQTIANNSTYLEAGTTVDIGNPPEGPG
jgi:uncharacterized membrane protein